MYAHMNACVCLCVYACVCMYVSVCACVCVCTRGVGQVHTLDEALMYAQPAIDSMVTELKARAPSLGSCTFAAVCLHTRPLTHPPPPGGGPPPARGGQS
jgi:hypothetical protein